MMMIQRQQQQQQQQHPTVEVPPWDPPYEDHPTVYSPQTNDYFAALHRYLPSRDPPEFDDSDTDSVGGNGDLPFDAYSCDSFRMYEFKVRRCARGRSHDWTECPFAHPGEKARRRDPRKYHYSGVACPDFRRGACRKGDACEYAHGVFECWLHPARYRTQPCKDGPHCKRRVCFFAHSHDQLRVLPTGPESPPSRLGLDSFKGMGVSPTSILDLPDSPPMSPTYCGPNSVSSVSELVNSIRGLQIAKMGCGGNMSPRSWGGGMQLGGTGYGSPRSPGGFGNMGGFCGSNGSMPSTPTRTPTRSGLWMYDPWDVNVSVEEEVPMERVESGKDLRARIYAKLSKENSLDRDRVDSVGQGGPDFGWVSELVK